MNLENPRDIDINLYELLEDESLKEFICEKEVKVKFEEFEIKEVDIDY